MTKKNNEKKCGFRVVYNNKVNTPESLLTIVPGSEIVVDVREFTTMNNIRVAAGRLNQKFGREEFEVSTNDNGATVFIRRNRYDARKA